MVVDQIPSHLRRDLLGYGRTPPRPHWPAETRMAVNIGMNCEQASEAPVQDRDGATETAMTHGSGGLSGRELRAEALLEHGSRVGVLRILAERGRATTMFWCAVPLERKVTLAEAIIEMRDSRLYHKGARQPKMMSVGLNMRIIGHPSRAAGLERLLDYVARHRDVWIARRVDIAEHWHRAHPYPGKGLNEV